MHPRKSVWVVGNIDEDLDPHEGKGANNFIKNKLLMACLSIQGDQGVSGWFKW